MRLASYILFGVAGLFGILSIILLVVYLRQGSSVSPSSTGRFRRIFRRGGRGSNAGGSMNGGGGSMNGGFDTYINMEGGIK
jgi:hypothetical protein